MSQTRLYSLIEKVLETFASFILSLLFAPMIFKLNGIESDMQQNFTVVLCFTLLAVVRGYVFRRLFNKLDAN